MSLFKRKRKGPLNVAILGSGPAGLFAAQAVYDTGNVARIFSYGKRSSLYGAQYLHAPVPGLDCGKPEIISYILKGTADDYRRKVYGDQNEGILVSPQVLDGQHEAWDIRAAYDEAWDQFSGLIRHGLITPEFLKEGLGSFFDLFVWSLPLQHFCRAGHQFQSKAIWAQGDAPDLGIACTVNVAPWTVICNGEESPRWYRASNVFGYRTAEWPDGVKPPVEGLAKVHKPISTNCNCWPEIGGARVIRVGRYGTWTKRELSHMAYNRTRAALEAW